MVLENPQSPNAIPPRTSSSGFTNGGSSSSHAHLSPQKPVLKPLSELDWLGQSKKTSSILQPTSPIRTHRPRQQSLPTTMAPSRAPDPPKRDIGHEQIFRRQPGWSAEKERMITGPYEYLQGHPGKDIRTELIAGFNKWLKVPEESLEVIKKVIGMLHTASLL